MWLIHFNWDTSCRVTTNTRLDNTLIEQLGNESIASFETGLTYARYFDNTAPVSYFEFYHLYPSHKSIDLLG